MDATQHLYYGLGQIAYAVADRDGKIQREEKEALQKILHDGMMKMNPDFDITDIIFQILEKEKVDFETAYKWGMDAIKLGSHHLTPGIKWIFIDIVQHVSEAFPGGDTEEAAIIARFAKDLRGL